MSSERPVFRIEGTGVRELELASEDTFNPYDRRPDRAPAPRAGAGAAKSGKKDLRKLSEWMKMMRELEERKKRGEE